MAQPWNNSDVGATYAEQRIVGFIDARKLVLTTKFSPEGSKVCASEPRGISSQGGGSGTEVISLRKYRRKTVENDRNSVDLIRNMRQVGLVGRIGGCLGGYFKLVAIIPKILQ